MNLFKVIGFFGLMGVLNFGISQTTVTGKVVGYVPIGNEGYYLIQEESTSKIYKTSMYSDNLYQKNDIVDLNDFTVSDDKLVLNSGGKIAMYMGEDMQAKIQALEFHDLPVYSNEILFFRDQDHYDKTYQQLEIIDSLFKDAETTDILKAFESKFSNFVSFREELINIFGDLEVDGITDLDMIKLEEYDFIGDVFIKALLSKHRLIGIDDRVYYYNYLNEIISVEKNDSTAIEILKDVSTHGRFDMTDHSHEVCWSKRFQYDMTELNLTVGKLDFDLDSVELRAIVQIGPTTALQTTPEHTNVENCNVRKVKLKVPLFYLYGVFTNQTSTEQAPMGTGTTLIIDWGDGIVQTVNNYHGSTWVEHTYADYGLYTATSTLLWGSYELIDVGQFNATIDCSSGDRANWKHTDNGNLRLRSKIWITHNWLVKQVGSYTHAYIKDGSVWKQTRANISNTIDGTFRDEVCIIKDQKDGSNSRSNAKEVQRIKTKLFAFVKSNSSANNDVTSTHKMFKNNTTITVNMQLIVCP